MKRSIVLLLVLIAWLWVIQSVGSRQVTDVFVPGLESLYVLAIVVPWLVAVSVVVWHYQLSTAYGVSVRLLELAGSAFRCFIVVPGAAILIDLLLGGPIPLDAPAGSLVGMFGLIYLCAAIAGVLAELTLIWFFRRVVSRRSATQGNAPTIE